MSVSDASILGEGLGLGGRDTAGRYVCERESWPRALFSLRLSGRQAAKSRAVPLRIRTCGSLRESVEAGTEGLAVVRASRALYP